MENYTVIYGDFFPYGSYRDQIIKYKLIQCEPENLKDVVEKNIGWDYVHYIFYGHCKQIND